MIRLLQKDFKALKYSLLPGILLGLPLLLLMQLPRDLGGQPALPWKESFWLSFFLGAVSVFYRSFSQEHRAQNFGVFLALGIGRPKILWSQALVQSFALVILGLAYAFMTFVFWSPQDFDFWPLFWTVLALSLSLAPLGTALGLFLQLEREFLFSLFFLPLTIPAFLAAQVLQTDGFSWSWSLILISYFCIGGFVVSLLFEFFFDELSQSL